MEVAVEAAGLVKTYRGRSGAVEAVRGVDLRVDAGEIFGFLGPNGAGKSTTVRMLTTLLSITEGSAVVAGLDVAREPDGVRRRIGVALQEAGLDARQTGRELLVLQGRLFDLSASEAATRAQELLELVELTDAADRRIKSYSGGMMIYGRAVTPANSASQGCVLFAAAPQMQPIGSAALPIQPVTASCVGAAPSVFDQIFAAGKQSAKVFWEAAKK